MSAATIQLEKGTTMSQVQVRRFVADYSSANITWQGLTGGKGVFFDYNTHQLSIIDFSVVPEPST